MGQVIVAPDAGALAAAVAARLLTKLTDLQAAGVVPKVVLTGGGVGIDVLAQVRASGARDVVDWGQVEFYWGDERFVPPGDPERNELQARAALLDHVPVDPAKVFPMGADTGGGPEAAAAAYAGWLAGRPFDVLMLGMGGEGHTASVFPDTPAVREQKATVVAVHDCPKPPPTRISLTLPAIRRATEVWIITAGAAKADAVAAAHTGAREVDIPVAGARGTERTLWLLDEAAAAKL